MIQVRRIVASFLETNCYLVWEDEARLGIVESEGGQPRVRPQALVVDPGVDTAEGVRKTAEYEEVDVVAVLLTHGHLDHLWDAAQVADPAGLPVYITELDMFFLEDPIGNLGFSPETFGSLKWKKPSNVVPLVSGKFSPVNGLNVRVIPAPGHSPGSAIFVFDDKPIGGSAFTGDVVFSGSVGRTDLPGGNEKEMVESLQVLGKELPSNTVLLPGHGDYTNWGIEMTVNPSVKCALGLN